MSQIKRGSSNVYYHDKEFMHVVRFFYDKDKSPAGQDPRTRWAFLVVGRDEMGDAFLQDKDKSNEERLSEIKDKYLPTLENCIKEKDEPAFTLDSTKISAVGEYAKEFNKKLIIRQSTPAKEGAALKSLLKGFGFTDEASVLKAGERSKAHFGYLRLDGKRCNSYLHRENPDDEAYALVAVPYVYNKKEEVYDVVVLSEHASVSLMPKVLIEYGVFFDGTKNSMYNVDFNLNFHKYLSGQKDIVLDKNAIPLPIKKSNEHNKEFYPNAATYIREVNKPRKDVIINAIRDEIQDNIRYFQNASKDEIAGEKTEYKSWWQDRASDHADKVFDFLVGIKDIQITARHSGKVHGLDIYEGDHILDPQENIMKISSFYISSYHTGRVKEVKIKNGDHVNKGDVLLVLDGRLEAGANDAVKNETILPEDKDEYKETLVKKYVYEQTLPSGEGSSFVNGYTNIKRLFEHYKGYDPLNTKESEPRKYTKSRFKVYASGDGCIDPYEGGKLKSDSAIGLGLAYGKTGVLAHIVYTCDKIAKNLRQNKHTVVDELVLDVFGFSRGAAEARHFVSSIMKEYDVSTSDVTRDYTLNTQDKSKNIFAPFYPRDKGVYTMIDNRPYFNPLRTDIEKISVEKGTGKNRRKVTVYNEYYEGRGTSKLVINSVSFRFIGIYDTVSHYGIAQSNDMEDLNLDFEESKLGRLVHLTAEDEYRKNFAMTHIKANANAFLGNEKIKEIALPGAHADVGGGYIDNEDSPRYIADSDEKRLLAWNRKYAWINPESDLEVIEAKGIKEIKRNKKAGFYRINNWIEKDNLYMYRPNISNRYEYVCMRLMHDEALNSDDSSEKVPFDEVSQKYAIDKIEDPLLNEVYRTLKSNQFEMHGELHKKLRQAYLHHSSDLDGIAPVDVNMPSMEGYQKKDEIYGKRIKYCASEKQFCFTGS
jgi:biotin carboxyl carrier protein